MRVKVGCSMSLTGCHSDDVLDLPDDLTPEQVAEEVREWALEQFEYWHEIEEPQP